ncbi:hypothetical protein [Streptomyces solincola]|uniref:hypothetical protein n=1 Tax=Streptomyces solincola TaxID=2100817 RepID=UPI0011B29EC5|nr:hypothetical protein [Streptomyces solincola]
MSRGRGPVWWVAVVAVAGVWTAVAPVAARAVDGEPSAYRFSPAAAPVRGASDPPDAPPLEAGRVYRDAVPAGATRVYRLDLDDRSEAYLSAVAIPPPSARVGITEGLAVSLRDPDGRICGSHETRFGAAAFPRPITAYAGRTATSDASGCRRAGTYYAYVERRGAAGAEGAENWEVELRHEREPGVRHLPSARPPEAAPAAPEGVPGDGDATASESASGTVAGGGGFADAAALAAGKRRDRIRPGESRFYRVPVDWGQRVSARAALTGSGGGLVTGALTLSLHNPALGTVASADATAAAGRPVTAALPPLPAVRYENRAATGPAAGGSGGRTSPRDVRFAGWYYLVVSASPGLAAGLGSGPYELELSVPVTGEVSPPPGYEGPAGIFQVTDADREAAARGASPQASSARDGERAGMRLLAATAFGTGSALAAGLAGWAFVSRRRERGAAGG